MKAIVIPANGPMRIEECNKSKELITKVVDGNIESLDLGECGTMYLNEDGKLINLPINYNATAMYAACYGYVDIIVGDVVVFGRNDCDFNDISAPDFLLELVMQKTGD